MLKKFFPRHELVRDLRTVAVAVIVSSVVLAAPSVAAKLVNADSVDGKSAVGAGASKTARAGKLVATSGAGVLPNNIIKKAQDADKLDGLNSTALVARVAARGHTQTGNYDAWGGGSGSYIGDTATLRSTLPVEIPSTRITFVANGGAYTPECPALGQVVPRGWVCVYEVGTGSSSYGNTFNPSTGGNGITKQGFGIYFSCTGASCWSYGSWAIKAGTAADVARSPIRGGARGNNPR